MAKISKIYRINEMQGKTWNIIQGSSLFYQKCTLVHLISHIPNKSDKYANNLTIAKAKQLTSQTNLIISTIPNHICALHMHQQLVCAVGFCAYVPSHGSSRSRDQCLRILITERTYYKINTFTLHLFPRNFHL